MKTCANCHQIKSFLDFNKDKSIKDGHQTQCRECRKQYSNPEYDKIYHLKNKEKRNQQGKEYNILNNERQKELKRLDYKQNKSKYKNYTLKKTFGITLEQYHKIFDQQNGCCAICQKHQKEFKRALAVDHCHKTKIIRGLLCGNCNTGIGKLKDSIKLLQKAIDYLINNTNQLGLVK